MTTFAKATFSAAGYAAFRPSYPKKLFDTVLDFHRGPRNTLLDLGCGHGLISRALSPSFKSITGTDPSSPMIEQAIASTPSSTYANIDFKVGFAEDLQDFQDGSLDMVVAGQAAHWFKFDKVWGELKRAVRSGGTIAFWGYKDNYFVDYPRATKVLDEYCYGDNFMGPNWEQPGRDLLRGLFKDIVPPPAFTDVTRILYEPKTEGKGSGEGEVLLGKKVKLGEIEGYTRTFSAYHDWMSKHEGVKAKKDGGNGDIVDEMFEKMLEVEPEWKAVGDEWRDFEVECEWGTVILMARNK